MDMNINLYESLANEIDVMIKTCVFGPGERLPSVRHLAHENQLSVSTVTQAMRLLQDRGLVDVKPQAGYYVRHRPKPLDDTIDDSDFKKPTYVDIKKGYTQILLANQNINLVQFASARLPDDLSPIKRLQSVVSSVARRSPSVLTSPGFFDLNEPQFVRQIVRRAADWGRIDPSEIIITNSGTEALSLCLRMVAKPGDTIAIESPCHILILNLIQTLGMQVLEIPSHPTTGISIEALELALRGSMVQACLFMTNVSNPLGCIMPNDHKKRMVDLLAKHDVPLIENDLYGDLSFHGERPVPAKAFDTAGNVLLCSSFSKVISSSLSAGYVMAGKYANEVLYLKALSSGTASHFNQAVLAGIIGGAGYNTHLRQIRRTMAQRIAQMSDAVSRYFPANCSISDPQGGFVIWVQMPPEVYAFTLHEAAIKKGIAFLPGPLFSASNKFSNYIRLNCSNPWTPTIEASIKLLGEIAQSLSLPPALAFLVPPPTLN
jgi:DNA-binding transcriptional MocR family regulator